MKIFKFLSVDAATGVSVEIEKPQEGAAKPNLSGMGTVYYFGGWMYAEVDDSNTADPGNYIHEITQGEYDGVIRAEFDSMKAERIAEAYAQEKDLRGALFGKYGESATAAGIYKYDLAKAYVADNTADAGIVATEATARGLTTLQMANKIVTNHESFRTKEAKLAGLRGKIVDRLEGLTWNASDAMANWTELTGRTETIGTRPEGDLPESGEDVVIGYYSVSLGQRWEWLS